jgi:exopolysaccharide production protein ExoQ
MTETYRFPAATRREGQGVWVLVDVALLFLTLIAASDMLVQTGKGQSLVWALCYGLVLLRGAMLWPHLGGVIGRNLLVLAYPLVCLASVIWSAAPLTTLVSACQLVMTLLIAGFLGWRYAPAAILRAVFIVLSLAVALSLLHWATGLFPWPVNSRSGGLTGIFSHKNMLGQRALFAAVIIPALWLMPRDQASPALKRFSLAVLPLVVLALVLSQSKTALLLLPALTGLLALFCLRRIPAALAAPVLALALIGLGVGPVLLALGGVDPLAVLLDALGKEATLTGRTEVWAVARQVWAEHPLLGVGHAAFWAAPEFANDRLLTQEAGALTSASFHNFVLEILVGTGLPGLLAMLALIGMAARRLIGIGGTVAGACGLVLLAGMLAASLVGASLYRAHEFMLLLMVMLCVSAGEDST